MIKTKRIYAPNEKADGYRILVDRLWPRGIKKEEAHFDEWMKDVAPSSALRKWFGHEAEKWPAFCKKYHAELNESNALVRLKEAIKKHKTVTLLYSAKDEQHNQAIALQKFLHA